MCLRQTALRAALRGSRSALALAPTDIGRGNTAKRLMRKKGFEGQGPQMTYPFVDKENRQGSGQFEGIALKVR
jgi:hypothetical protein